MNARTVNGQLPIDMGYRNTEEIRQAIRDETERRDQQPRKRCVEDDRQPNATTSADAQQDDQEDDEERQNGKQPAEGEAEEGEVTEEDQDSEPSSDEDGN